MATLLQMRTKIAKESGRYDLIVDDSAFADNGMDWHIAEATRWLDRRFQYKKQAAWLYKKGAVGQSLITMTRARWIEEVWIAYPGTTYGRSQLTRQTLRYMRSKWPDVPLSAITNGTPTDWAPLVVGLAPQQFADDATSLTNAGMTDIDFLQYGNYYLTDSIVVMPPMNVAYTIEVKAQWMSILMTSDSDVNFWSVNEPGLLESATMLSIEKRLHRNSEGVNDYTLPLLDDLKRLADDMISEEISGPSETAARMFA